jgi:hypothetical protein
MTKGGRDLEIYHGVGSWFLPIPATYRRPDQGAIHRPRLPQAHGSGRAYAALKSAR